VKICFQTYLEQSGLIETVLELNRRGLKTKAFVSRKGRIQEPHSWVANALHKVLSNPLYHGAIRHKSSEYPGEHEAIIDDDLWNAVQTKLREHQPEFRKTSGHLNEIATAKTRLIHPLKGFIFGIDGQALTPTYTNKSQKAANGTKTRKRYRYYVSQQAIRQGYGSSPLKTLSASLIEDAVRRMLIHALPALSEYIPSGELSSSEIRHRLGMHATYLAQLDTPVEFAKWLKATSPRIVVGSDTLAIHILKENLPKLALSTPDESAETQTLPPSIPTIMTEEGDRIILSANISFKPRRGRSQIIDRKTGKAITARSTAPNPALIQTIAQAEFWRSELLLQPEKSLEKITAEYGVKPRYIRRLLNAAYLAPAIKRAIFQGIHPAHLQVQDLIAEHSLDWQSQLQELGFDDSTAVA
jgi:hypothetical protein